jgi:hypothetical protein
MTSVVNLTLDPTSPVPPKSNHANHTVITGTGTTGHCLDADAEQRCIDIHKTTSGPCVQVTNGDTIVTTKRATVPQANELSTQAKVGHIFHSAKSGLLISIGQLCNNNCATIFTKHNKKLSQERTGHHRLQAQQDQCWSLECSPSPKSNSLLATTECKSSQHLLPFHQWCHPTGQNKARLSCFPSCFCFQSTPLPPPLSFVQSNVCNPTWPFQPVAPSHPVSHQQAPLQVTCHQQRRPSPNATEESPAAKAQHCQETAHRHITCPNRRPAHAVLTDKSQVSEQAVFEFPRQT